MPTLGYSSTSIFITKEKNRPVLLKCRRDFSRPFRVNSEVKEEKPVEERKAWVLG
jgi:hypothetical protein